MTDTLWEDSQLAASDLQEYRAGYTLTPLDAETISGWASLILAQAAELATLREVLGNNCNALTAADRAYLIAHLSYELEPVGKPPTWNQLAMEVIRLSNAIAALKGGA